MELRDLTADEYAACVLPETHALWHRGRSFETYVDDTRALAASPYGKKHFRTIALQIGGKEVVASCKRYERDARVKNARLRAVGIGAVFTREVHRGRGYATAMLAMLMDEARAAGVDFAFLYSDLHPQFYRQLSFVELPS